MVVLAQAEGDVVEDRQAVEQRGHLEQEPEPEPHLHQLLAVELGDVAAVELDAALGRVQQADDQLEHHRLAAAALADDADRLAAADRQVDVAQDRLVAEAHAHAAQRDQVVVAWPPSGSLSPGS